jgi:hypothetical protein
MSPTDWRYFWTGGQRGFRTVRRISMLYKRAEVLTEFVPRSALRHLSAFQRSRLVLLVERMGEYGATAARRALTGRERDALRAMAQGINRIVASGQAAATEHAALAARAQAHARWVRATNVRRAASRGVLGTLGVGGTVLVGSLLAILAVGLYANARITSKIDEIRAAIASGDPGVLVVGLPPEDECVVDEAAARGLIWSDPDGDPSGTGCTAADCSWHAPEAEPEWTRYTGVELENMRTAWAQQLPGIVAGPLAEAREACGYAGGVVAGETPLPTPDEVCSFLPDELTLTGQQAITVTAEETHCVGVDFVEVEGSQPYPRIWVEAVVPSGQTADSWLSFLPDGISFVRGDRIEYDIGDRAMRFENDDNHALIGFVGPVGFVLSAGVGWGGTADIQWMAEEIVVAYRNWAANLG